MKPRQRKRVLAHLNPMLMYPMREESSMLPVSPVMAPLVVDSLDVGVREEVGEGRDQATDSDSGGDVLLPHDREAGAEVVWK